MEQIKITYSTSFADDLADISFFIQSKGLKSTAIKFATGVYDFIESRDFKL